MTKSADFAPETVTAMRAAMTAARSGDVPGARSIAERALADGKDSTALHAMLGMLCCQLGDFASGIDHLQSARRSAPADVTIASNLVAALIETNAVDDALTVCTREAAAADPSLRLWRFRGYLLLQKEDFGAAAEAYRTVVDRAADDFESWNNLGNAYAGAEDYPASIAALRRAVVLRPDAAPTRLNLAATLLAADEWDEASAVLTQAAADFPEDAKPLVELSGIHKQRGDDAEALAVLEEAVGRDSTDAELQVMLGVERIANWQMDEAGDALRSAIALEPDHRDAHVILGVLMEHTNRPDQFGALIERARANGVEEGAIAFIRALDHRRERRFEEGLAALSVVPDDLEPARRMHLTGQFHDRLGDVDAAFAAFTEMNRINGDDPSQPLRRGAEYRAALAADRAVVTPDWYAQWSAFTPDDGVADPVFLVGFPRSGTTLLDTMLMGHPDVQVMEELPALTRVEQQLGGLARLPALDQAELSRLRSVYFAEVDRHFERRAGALLIDKFPLHLNKVPIIRRLFPTARFILAMRHPCDVLLSCYVTNFRLNNAMVNFLDLETGAWVYDQTFAFWTQASELMGVPCHRVTYEDMIADPAGELRPFFAYLGLDWHDAALDHQRTATERGTISTASYSQVTEPIYARSAGRWQRYRRHLEPILPVLRPWIERFGYEA